MAEHNDLRSFLAAYAESDWRRNPSKLPGSAAAAKLEAWALSQMRQRCAILSVAELQLAIREAAADSGAGLDAGTQCFADRLLVLQLGKAVRDLVSRRLTRFASRSVPDGVFWRKNAARDWPTQCLPDRYGWVSDSESVRGLLAVLAADGTGERFCETMGFTRTERRPHGGYGPMFFMFYTERQLRRLECVELFRPTWPDLMHRFNTLLSRRIAEDTLGRHVSELWITSSEAWRDAGEAFGRIVAEVTDGEARLRFQRFAISSCKPLWDAGAPEGGAMDPRWLPVAAVRQLLDQWFGANHLFMGDGFAWSEQGVRGYAEWLLSSFENLEVDRVSIFPASKEAKTVSAKSKAAAKQGAKLAVLKVPMKSRSGRSGPSGQSGWEKWRRSRAEKAALQQRREEAKASKTANPPASGRHLAILRRP
eukprot:CAMPEP_0172681084 /NCGR_PEP_ID=MMETSP1074-20121228/17208_1 /TAXON_ID=2916 /ORGANISM="Ceratium fusus, Strain PA161109" /LENGTH=421 /DNA_ID=CAMNT_0013499533 /DNA_START=21 /DNA_END=1282 /DNA_ORIENTATION=+